ncbi:GIY-YIG nuclease family protein [Cohnella soli]|uniref:GIY-YIG nuclease family protein n=1 Tax=Cohnella soli TaxID=425005 RepID=A0ABW0I4Q5_9BACL
MDKNRRKELQEAYKEIKIYMGVIQIKNVTNGKIYLASYPNLKNKWLMIQAQLDMGRFANLELQKDWKELGAGAFEYEVLEQKVIDDITDMKWELKVVLKPWLERLRPYEDKGYNREK